MSFLEQHDQLSQFASSVIKNSMTGGMAWDDFANSHRLAHHRYIALHPQGAHPAAVIDINR